MLDFKTIQSISGGRILIDGEWRDVVGNAVFHPNQVVPVWDGHVLGRSRPVPHGRIAMAIPYIPEAEPPEESTQITFLISNYTGYYLVTVDTAAETFTAEQITPNPSVNFHTTFDGESYYLRNGTIYIPGGTIAAPGSLTKEISNYDDILRVIYVSSGMNFLAKYEDEAWVTEKSIGYTAYTGIADAAAADACPTASEALAYWATYAPSLHPSGIATWTYDGYYFIGQRVAYGYGGEYHIYERINLAGRNEQPDASLNWVMVANVMVVSGNMIVFNPLDVRTWSLADGGNIRYARSASASGATLQSDGAMVSQALMSTTTYHDFDLIAGQNFGHEPLSTIGGGVTDTVCAEGLSSGAIMLKDTTEIARHWAGASRTLSLPDTLYTGCINIGVDQFTGDWEYKNNGLPCVVGVRYRRPRGRFSEYVQTGDATWYERNYVNAFYNDFHTPNDEIWYDPDGNEIPYCTGEFLYPIWTDGTNTVYHDYNAHKLKINETELMDCVQYYSRGELKKP